MRPSKLSSLFFLAFTAVSFAMTPEEAIGEDAVYLQKRVVAAIDQTSPEETCRVKLPDVNPRTGTNDYYFKGRALGIVFPRSHFEFDGNGARFHVDVDGGGHNGDILTVSGLRGPRGLAVHLFEPGRVYRFPEAGRRGSAVEVIFARKPDDETWVSEVATIRGGSRNYGQEMRVENVKISNVTLLHHRPEKAKHLNGVGVVHADDVELTGIHVVNCPQTSFAVVGEATRPTTRVRLHGCTSVNSRNEAYRFILYGPGPTAISGEMYGCAAFGSGPAANLQPGDTSVDAHLLSPRRSHVWYRAWDPSDPNYLRIDNCTFDASAEISATQGAPHLSVTNSMIMGGLSLFGNEQPCYENSDVKIQGNFFNCYYAKGQLPSAESAVHIRHIKGVTLNANRIYGDRLAWYSSSCPVVQTGNYSLKANGTLQPL